MNVTVDHAVHEDRNLDHSIYRDLNCRHYSNANKKIVDLNTAHLFLNEVIHRQGYECFDGNRNILLDRNVRSNWWRNCLQKSY